MAKYQVHLVQHEWVTTEVFEVEETSEDAARTYVEKNDLEGKDLENKEFRLDVIEIKEEENETNEPDQSEAQ